MTRPLNSSDADLFGIAQALLNERHDDVIHQVAAAVKTSDGQVFKGLHIGSRRINVCAESSAIANAVMAGAGDIALMVAVCKNSNGDVVVTNPCGVCRELMGTYALEAEVIVDNRGSVEVVPARDLMPHRWMFPHENDWIPNDPSEI